MSRLPLVLLGCLLVPAAALAAAPPPRERDLSVAELARVARPSVVVLRVPGRDGKSHGVGTGFVVAADGLIATNQHVIGEGRAVTVEMADGSQHEVVSVHASDRRNDLALVRINAKGLPVLPLGDDATLRDGQDVVALGNPRGLKHSVVAGVVSGKRTIDGRPMIQVAIPIEPGNSGGPLLDRRGRVVGVMTLKSLDTDNFGFAAGVRTLLPLLRKPNPVPMAAWLTLGALDGDEWQTVGPGRWRQRAGRIIGSGRGAGIGGRSLCLSRREVPALPFEVEVMVRLEDEGGAAGLAFHADGGDRHYGFYPSGGQLRLTRFDGPDVFTWKVLQQKASPAYRPGEWNALKVRLEKGRIRCLVNDQVVFDVSEAAFSSGQVGLARFRETVAEFKRFRVGKELSALRAAPGLVAGVTKALAGTAPGAAFRPEALAKMPAGTPATLKALREQARLLEQQAAQMRRLALALHQREVLAEMAKVLQGKDGDVDLIHAALLIARLDNDELDVDAYRAEMERMARKVLARVPDRATDERKLAELARFLFREKGFHGSRGDYYNRSNSYLSEVIDDREGLPITLSVLYIGLARRLGVTVEGVGLPGHFVVRHVPKKGAGQLIDVYEGGTRMSRADAERKVRAMAGRPLEDDDLAAVPPRLILSRMLHNLVNVARGERDLQAMLRYTDAIIAIHPQPAQERGLRAGLRFQAGDLTGAREDVEWLLEKKPEGIDLERVRQMRRFLQQRERDGE
jgi:regulator of sirC expression with transglutaminase-like and TPR domain